MKEKHEKTRRPLRSSKRTSAMICRTIRSMIGDKEHRREGAVLGFTPARRSPRSEQLVRSRRLSSWKEDENRAQRRRNRAATIS